MDKEDVVYTHARMYIHAHTHTVEYYLAMKKSEILPFETWVELEGIMLVK